MPNEIKIFASASSAILESVETDSVAHTADINGNRVELQKLCDYSHETPQYVEFRGIRNGRTWNVHLHKDW